jgi:hypothetical protein
MARQDSHGRSDGRRERQQHRGADLHPNGEDFVKKLYLGQNIVLTRERRQLTDWLARGTYPISFGAQSSDVERMRKEGFNLKEIYGFPDMPPALSGSPWLLTLMNKALHPNAARVFANWIVSKEGLEIYARAEGRAALRTDTDESFISAEERPKEGIKEASAKAGEK